jgi:hypothetical protein
MLNARGNKVKRKREKESKREDKKGKLNVMKTPGWRGRMICSWVVVKASIHSANTYAKSLTVHISHLD